MSNYCKTKCICRKCGRPRTQLRRCKSGTQVYGTSTSRSTAPSSTRSTASTQVKDVSEFGIPATEFRHPAYRGATFNIAYPGACHEGVWQTRGVLRWVRRRHACDARDDLQAILHSATTAQEFAHQFVEEIDTRGWSIEISQPKFLRAEGDETYHPKGYVCLFEKFLPGFAKFTDVSGWADNPRLPHNALVQAFAHFVFVATGKALLITNLQGNVDASRKTIVLSCPVVLSADGGEYGCRDVGMKGFNNFLQNHTCSPLCKHLRDA